MPWQVERLTDDFISSRFSVYRVGRPSFSDFVFPLSSCASSCQMRSMRSESLNRMNKLEYFLIVFFFAVFWGFIMRNTYVSSTYCQKDFCKFCLLWTLWKHWSSSNCFLNAVETSTYFANKRELVKNLPTNIWRPRGSFLFLLPLSSSEHVPLGVTINDPENSIGIVSAKQSSKAGVGNGLWLNDLCHNTRKINFFANQRSHLLGRPFYRCRGLIRLIKL